MLPSDDLRVLALTQAVHAGDVEAAGVLLRQNPELATDRHGDALQSRTALHIATDWPLLEAGADLDWLGYDNLTSRQAGMQSDSVALIAWLEAQR